MEIRFTVDWNGQLREPYEADSERPAHLHQTGKLDIKVQLSEGDGQRDGRRRIECGEHMMAGDVSEGFHVAN